VEWLARAGISSILTLTVEPLPPDFTKGLNITTGHVPMEDHQPPSVDAMARAVGFIAEQLRAGRATLVHCLAGEGRTGCALAAYLIDARSMSADEALQALRNLKPEFVEGRQVKAVRDFASSRKL
jgi:protein-tyrosine phosphatase